MGVGDAVDEMVPPLSDAVTDCDSVPESETLLLELSEAVTLGVVESLAESERENDEDNDTVDVGVPE